MLVIFVFLFNFLLFVNHYAIGKKMPPADRMNPSRPKIAQISCQNDNSLTVSLTKG
jgi:hypothetical protein